MEVDHWTGFSRCFEHAGGYAACHPELPAQLYAAVLAQGCNLGLTRMAHITDLDYQRLAWTTQWYLRDATLKAAVTGLVNDQGRQPLSASWGGGTFSSSDGHRFPVAGHAANATALPRYFGYGRGVTFLHLRPISSRNTAPRSSLRRCAMPPTCSMVSWTTKPN